jgi:hypothetical protein
MIASDRDGAITRTDEPERSFGGTTGTSPYWPIPAGVGNRVTGTVTCRRRDARRGARSRRRPRTYRDGRERGVFLFPCGQHPFADTSLPDVLSFPGNIE